tara:strand:+ start:170 stop:973 length:804 start_codon:yes stop_codon:yes gene_type:complete
MSISELLESSTLAEGDTERMNCPECGGYNTFTLSKRDGRFMWNCYKASCNCSGKSMAYMNSQDIRTRLSLPPTDRVADVPVQKFTMPEHIIKIPSPVLDAYATQYNIQKTLWFDVQETRAVFPIYDREGETLLGAVGRAMIPVLNERVKWKRYDKQKDLMYFTDNNRDVAVLVEDCVSAEACFNAGYTGIALLGTSLHESRIKDLIGYKEIIIALDNDASIKSLKIKSVLDDYVNCRVVLLEDDLKYFSPVMVQGILSISQSPCPSL